MNKNPYLTEEKQTTTYGIIGQGLQGLGVLLPPPFNAIAFGVGLVVTAYAFYQAKDREQPKKEP